jgi:hypothetical protein
MKIDSKFKEGDILTCKKNFWIVLDHKTSIKFSQGKRYKIEYIYYMLPNTWYAFESEENILYEFFSCKYEVPVTSDRRLEDFFYTDIKKLRKDKMLNLNNNNLD